MAAATISITVGDPSGKQGLYFSRSEKEQAMIFSRPWMHCFIAIGVIATAVLPAGCFPRHNPLGVLTEVSTTEILEQARDHFKAREFNDALAMYEWALQRDPDNAEYYYLAGMCLLLTDRHARSEYFFRTALAKEPGFLPACRGLAMSLHGQDKVHQAAAEWREVCRLNAKRAAAFIELGRCEHRAGNLEAALTAFNTAVRLEPENANAHLELGMFFKAIGRIDPALAQVRIAFRLDADTPALRARIARELLLLSRRAADRQPIQQP